MRRIRTLVEAVDPIPQGLKPFEGELVNVGAKAPTPGGLTMTAETVDKVTKGT
jgi:hypothetical protein